MLCDSLDCDTSDLPVLHLLLEFPQTHVHLVSDAIQPSYPLSSPSPAFNLSQHQSFPMSQLFMSGDQSIVIILFLLFYTEKPVFQRICMTNAKVL